MSYYVAYGEGDAGDSTLYGLGRTPEEALRDSVQYGYDIDEDEPHLFVDGISERAYKYIISRGSNDMEDDVFNCIEFAVHALDVAVVVALFLVVLPGLKPCHQLFISSKSKFVHFSISLLWFFCNYDTASLY